MIEEMELAKSWNRFECDFTHISVRDGVTFSHILDHFLWSQNTDDCVTDAGVIHHVDNTSDHSPIFCCFSASPVTSKNNKK